MADYRDNYILDVAGKADIDALTRSTTALADAGDRAAKGGMRNFSGGIVQATRAAQDFQAAGMMGISNNIIEIGAAFGPWGVAIGATLTAVALNWKHFTSGVEDFASRPVVDSIVDKFKSFGSMVATTFTTATGYVDTFFDVVLGENVAKAKTKLVDYETGIRKVEIALKENRKAQEELTQAGSLDASQIAKLNLLRAEEVKHLKEREQLMEAERIRKDYGNRATEEEIKRGEAFKKAFSGKEGARLLAALQKSFRGEDGNEYDEQSQNDAAAFISQLEKGKVTPEQLQQRLRMSGLVGMGDGSQWTQDWRNWMKGVNPKDVIPQEKALHFGLPFMQAQMFGALGFGKDMTIRDIQGAADQAAFVDQNPLAAGVAAMARGARPDALKGVADNISGMAEHAFPARPTGDNARRKSELADLNEQLRGAFVNMDPQDRKLLEEMQVTVKEAMMAARSRAETQQILIGYAKAVLGSLNGIDMNEEHLRREIAQTQHRLRQRGGPGFGVLGGFGGL